jgi:hypothetical protein
MGFWTLNKGEDDFPLLAPSLRRAFVVFVNCANEKSPHPKDMRRFYEFVRLCHARRSKLTEDQLRDYLVQAHFPRDIAERLTCVYYHGRALLKVNCR